MGKILLSFTISSLLVICTANVNGAEAKSYDPPFPRLMGMNIGEKNYDDPAYQRQISRLNVVILGFYPSWKAHYTYKGYTGIRAAVRAIKDRNPDILVGQYTVLNEVKDGPTPDPANSDKVAKLNEQDWWLTDSEGKRVQWTNKYAAYDINITDMTRPDNQGMQWPEWLAARDNKKLFKPVPEFDIWYFDNVFERNRIKYADWKQAGRDISCDSPAMVAAHRKGHVAEWRKARLLQPSIYLMGNVDNDLSMPEYRGKLQGAFLEALMGKSWSLERRQGWEAMMRRYHGAIRNTGQPKLVGFNVWGDPKDYQFFRYAFTSSLMDDGYFSFTDEQRGYSSVPWFDEYQTRLGKPLQRQQSIPWFRGVFRRKFENGIALVNPTWRSVTVRVGSGYRHLNGTQDPDVNNGQSVAKITIPAKDGILLIRE